MSGAIYHAELTGAPADPDALIDGPNYDAAHTLTGQWSPSQGGTGVANNSASTITITGSFGITFTITADTSLTFPTTGTVATLAGTETLTNKTIGNTNTITLKDTLFTLQDDGDTTKQFKLDLSVIPTSTTRVWTVPNADDAFVGLVAAQNITNKTFDNSNTFSIRDDRFTLQDSAVATKQAVFELSGIATATTRTYTLPDASGTVALTTSTVSNATNAVNSGVTQDSASAVNYIPFVASNSGNVPLKVGATTSSITFNPSIPSVGIGTPAATISLLALGGGGTTLTGTQQFAMNFQPTFSSAATSNGIGLYVAPSTVNASYTMTSMQGVYIDNGTKGASSTITTQYQLYISAPTLGTTKYSIYSGGGMNYLGGSIGVGTTTDRGTGTINMTGGLFLGSFVVASAPTGTAAGNTAYFSNCRVFNGAGTQEGAGAGTGGMGNYNGSAWKIAGTNVTIVA